MAEDVIVRLVLDTSGYTSKANQASKATNQISKSADGTTKSAFSLKEGLGKLGIAMGAAFAAKLAVDFARDSIAAFSNLEESINAVNVSYLDGSDAIHELGENSAEQFGLSTTAVNDAAVAMSAFADKIDAADPPGAFENVLQRATDFASVMNLEVEEALLVFRSGLAGESEPLRKFGIDVSAATVNLVGLEAGLGGATGKLSEGEKVQARYLAIMEQTEKVVGDFANTADGLANSQKILSAKWQEAQAVIGEGLAPVMTDLLNLGVELIPLFVNIGKTVGRVIRELLPIIRLIGDLGSIISKVAELTEESAAAQETYGNSLISNLGPLGKGIDAVLEMREALRLATEGTAESTQENIDAQIAWDNLDPTVFDGDLESLGNSLGAAAIAQATASDATTRYNDVLTGAAARAREVAAAERERAAGIREALRAQAEAANPLIRLLRTQTSLVAAQERLDEIREDEQATLEDTNAAVVDLVSAQADFEGAALGVTGAVDEGVDAFERFGTVAGATDEELIAVRDTLDGFPTSLDIDLNLVMGGLSIGEAREILRGTGEQPPTMPAAPFVPPRAFDRLAHGGPVNRGEPVIVGERGPELFLPDSGGQIVPNNGLGGTTIHIHQPETIDLSADLAEGLIAGQITQQVETLSF